MKVDIEEEEFAALIAVAYLMVDEDTYLTKRLLFLADSYLAARKNGECSSVKEFLA